MGFWFLCFPPLKVLVVFKTILTLFIMCFSSLHVFFLALVCTMNKSENDLDIWDAKQWIEANQKGIDPGSIKFCEQEWYPITISAKAPKVFQCQGRDVLWLSYQVHVQKVLKNTFVTLNDRFAVVVSHGRLIYSVKYECNQKCIC